MAHRNKNMNKKIITIAFVSVAVFLSQGSVVFASITPAEIITLVNQEREQAGLSPLHRNSVLDAAASGKADDMAAEQYFSHTSPKGVTPWDWFRGVKYEYRYAGENLAIHFRDAALEHRAWMESKKHCENIMSPKYLEIGLAVREMEWKGKQTTIAVQMFGTQLSDEKDVDLSKKANGACPKSYPSVLGASLPSDNNGGMVGAVSGFLLDIAAQYRIDTGRLLALIFFAGAQLSGLFVVLMLATHERSLRKW